MSPSDLYRREALERHVRMGQRVRGHVLRQAPGWLGGAHALLLSLLLAGAAVALLGRAPVYDHGTAVVAARPVGAGLPSTYDVIARFGGRSQRALRVGGSLSFEMDGGATRVLAIDSMETVPNGAVDEVVVHATLHASPSTYREGEVASVKVEIGSRPIAAMLLSEHMTGARDGD